MASMKPRCVCPHEDFSNEISNNAACLTVDQAASVASGYQPCCARWIQDAEFRRLKPNEAEVASLFRQELKQAIACRELETVPDALKESGLLIDRQVLRKWIENWRMRKGLLDEVSLSEEPLVLRRARAIRELIGECGLDSQNITVKQKQSLRSEVKRRYSDLAFTQDTFGKAWIEGGHQGWWSIKGKEKFIKGHRFQVKNHNRKF